MKKTVLIALSVIALVACNNYSYKRENVQLTNQADSLNYTFGYDQGKFIANNVLGETLNSPKSKTAFCAGFNERFGMDEEKRTEYDFDFQAQSFGFQLMKDVEQGFFSGDSTFTLKKDMLVKNIREAIDGKSTIDPEEANTAFRNYMSMEKHVRTEAEIDSMNMLFGILNGSNIKAYMESVTDINDPTERFKKNFEKGLKIKQNEIEEAHMQGITIAAQLENMLQFYGYGFNIEGIDTDANLIKAGLLDYINEYETLFTPETAESYYNNTREIAVAKELEAKYGSWKTENEEFIAQNKDKKGIVTTESGLQYRIIKQGKGALPQATDRVRVHYEGKTINDSIFDSSYQRKEPTEFGVNQVIEGWKEGLQLMPVGSTFEFFIPQELGYGQQGAGESIKPFSTLIFKVELLDIVK